MAYSAKEETMKAMLSLIKKIVSFFIKFIFVTLIIAALATYCTSSDFDSPLTDEQTKQKQLEKQAKKLQKEQKKLEKKLEEKRKKQLEQFHGRHCVSSWDGTAWRVNDVIQENLLVPDSFTHIETKISVRNSQNQHRVEVAFQAQSAIGLMIYQKAEALISSENCNVISLKFIE